MARNDSNGSSNRPRHQARSNSSFDAPEDQPKTSRPSQGGSGRSGAARPAGAGKQAGAARSRGAAGTGRQGTAGKAAGTGRQPTQGQGGAGRSAGTARGAGSRTNADRSGATGRPPHRSSTASSDQPSRHESGAIPSRKLSAVSDTTRFTPRERARAAGEGRTASTQRSGAQRSGAQRSGSQRSGATRTGARPAGSGRGQGQTRPKSQPKAAQARAEQRERVIFWARWVVIAIGIVAVLGVGFQAFKFVQGKVTDHAVVVASPTVEDSPVACSADNVDVKLTPSSVYAGRPITFALEITNKSKTTPCYFDAGYSNLGVELTSGTDTIVDTRACKGGKANRLLLLDTEYTTKMSIGWDGTFSGSTCKSGGAASKPGTYVARVVTGDGYLMESGVPFELVPAPAPAPKPSATTTPAPAATTPAAETTPTSTD